jgi:glycosyltransferase involved in cell wall biosynthesis
VRPAARARLNIPHDAFVLMFAATAPRSNPFKDYETIRNAVARLTALGRPIWLIVVGDAAPEERLGSVHVRHVPYIESAALMAQYYQAADLYLHAAKNEVFGIVIAEALACGLPVVATAVDGVPELLDDGQHGYLVPAQDAPAMAAAIEKLQGDTSLRQAMSARAAERARQRFDKNAMIHAYLEWYGEVCDAISPTENCAANDTRKTGSLAPSATWSCINQ